MKSSTNVVSNLCNPSHGSRTSYSDNTDGIRLTFGSKTLHVAKSISRKCRSDTYGQVMLMM